MAEETKNAVEAAPVTTTEVAVAVPDVPEAEKPVEVTEKAAPAVLESEEVKDEEKIGESGSFKEESNVVGELPDPEKLALDELKALVQEALNKHEFTAPPPPPPVKEEEKPAEVVAEAPTVTEEAPKEAESEVVPVVAEPVVEKETPVTVPEPVVEKIVEKTETVVDDDGAKTVEAIAETVIAVCPPVPATEEPTTSTPAEESTPVVVEEVKEEVVAPVEEPVPEVPLVPEEVSIWGIPLLADERSDVILLKFLRARDFKVKEAFAMLKSVVAWRKEFGIEDLLAEEFGTEHEKVVFMHGVDKEGHPVCYNSYGEFQNKELYINTFSDEEKRTKFLRWRIQFLEKNIRNLDFSPDGICSFVQVNDLKDFPGLFKRELRQATNQAFQILQDNYPEFAAKQVMINVPWWYLAFYKMTSPFFTVRTKSKFVFAGPSKTAETLFKYIAPEQVPVQYGGLKDGEQEFTSHNPAIEEIVKPTAKHTIEFSIAESCQLVWEARVVGWEVSYGAEFVPSAEDGYTVIIQKTRKILPSDEPIICNSFKIGEPGKVVLTFDNQTSKKKKLLYRSKTVPSSESA